MAAEMKATAPARREGRGSLRKFPSGRWQARYPAPDAGSYTARTDGDKPLTFLTKTDARAWLASVHTKIARNDWEPPAVLAARRRAEVEADRPPCAWAEAEYAHYRGGSVMETVRPVARDRRVRGMGEKRSRIFESARRLIAEHGFDGVTTQQISDAADVGAGTLFRYASNKGELLMMVFNEEFKAAISEGERAAQRKNRTEAVWALVGPVLDFATRNPGNVAVYQRELLFGSPSAHFRAEGLALVRRWEDSVAAQLVGATEPGAQHDALRASAQLAARSIFAVLHLAISSPLTSATPGAELRAQVDQIIHGYTAGAGAAPASTSPAPGSTPLGARQEGAR